MSRIAQNNWTGGWVYDCVFDITNSRAITTGDLLPLIEFRVAGLTSRVSRWTPGNWLVLRTAFDLVRQGRDLGVSAARIRHRRSGGIVVPRNCTRPSIA